MLKENQYNKRGVKEIHKNRVNKISILSTLQLQ